MARPRLALIVRRTRLAFMAALSACAGPASPRHAEPKIEQLTCGDSTAPLAVYRRAATATNGPADSSASLLIRVVAGPGARPSPIADVQLWGANRIAGGPTDSLGVTRYIDRPAGLYRLAMRQRSEQPRPWQYAAMLRAGYFDTVVVRLDARCTLIWARNSP